jgi:pilus assembly protein CpaE
MSILRSQYDSPVKVQDRLAEAVGDNQEDAQPAPYLVTNSPELPRSEALMVALIGPQDERRREMVRALVTCEGTEVRAFSSYPPSLEDTPRLLEENHDVVIVELDSDPEFALDLVEGIGASSTTTVMVYSETSDPDLLMRALRAGAREFFTPPFEHDIIVEALQRAEERRSALATAGATSESGIVTEPEAESARPLGRLLPFMGAKGGTGVTTLALNFAVSLARDDKRKTLLIDLDLPLGDAGLSLGVISEYSTITALQSEDRLDVAMLTRLATKHDSGLWVLAAPGKFQHYEVDNKAIDKLIEVAQAGFDYVVVDLGSRVDLSETSLLQRADTIYLVTQTGVPEMRNSNRLISQFFGTDGPNLEVVLNRYDPHSFSLSEEDITKALTRPAKWKIPNDYATARRMQINATPLALDDSAVAGQIRRMAGSITGETPAPVKKRGFKLFGR